MILGAPESRALAGLPELLAHGRCRVADLVYRGLQLFARDAEMLRPILNLEVLVHVDQSSVRLPAMNFAISHLDSPPFRSAAKTRYRQACSR
jgi:hypothetical protein